MQIVSTYDAPRREDAATSPRKRGERESYTAIFRCRTGMPLSSSAASTIAFASMP